MKHLTNFRAKPAIDAIATTVFVTISISRSGQTASAWFKSVPPIPIWSIILALLGS